MSRVELAFPIAALALLAAWAAPASAAPQARSLEQQIPAAGKVRIEHLAGQVELVAGRGERLAVTARIHAEGKDAAETRRLLDAMRWEDRGGTWTLTWPVERYGAFAYPTEGLSSWGSGSTTSFRGRRLRVFGSRRPAAPVLYADLRIAVPAGARLEVRNAVGPVAASGLSGELRIDTGRGRVVVEGFDGVLDVDTGSGSIRVSDVRGRLVRLDTGSGAVRGDGLEVDGLDVDTGSGSVRLARIRARNLRADTGSGSVALDDVEAEQVVVDTGSGSVTVRGDLSGARSILVDTGSGSVTLEGGPDFEFDLRASQGSGSLRVGYADARLVQGRRGKVVAATRGSARTRVIIDTGSGSATVRP
jgi:hypothetical protein